MDVKLLKNVVSAGGGQVRDVFRLPSGLNNLSLP